MFQGGGNTACEGPKAGKSWVCIRNKEKPCGHSLGEEKIARWKVSRDQTMQGLEDHGESPQFYAAPVGSPEVWRVW